MEKLLTLEEIRSEYKNYYYVESATPYSLILFFEQILSKKQGEIHTYRERAKIGVISELNGDVYLSKKNGYSERQEKITLGRGVGQRVCKFVNEKLTEIIEKEFIPDIEKEIERINLVIKSLCYIHGTSE